MADDEHGDAVDPTAQYRALTEVVTDAIVTIDADSTIRFANDAIEDVFGYAPDELGGRSLTVLMDDDLASDHEAGFARYLRTGDRTLDWDYVELVGRHRDGSPIPLGVSFAEFTDDGERLFTGVVRDISDRKAWEARLTRLNDLSHELVEQPSATDVCTRVHTAAEELFDAAVAMALYDDDRGELRREVASAGFDNPDRPLSGLLDLAWEAFATSETLVAHTGPAADVALPARLHDLRVLLGRRGGPRRGHGPRRRPHGRRRRCSGALRRVRGRRVVSLTAHGRRRLRPSSGGMSRAA